MPPSPEAHPATSASLRDYLFVPLLSTQTIGHLNADWTLLLGIFSGLWSGSFMVTSTQTAFNSVRELLYAQRPSFGAQIGRSIIARSAIAITLIGSAVVSSYITGLTAGTKLSVVGGLAGDLIAIALDVGLFVGAFRLLTAREVATRDVLPGALLSGFVFWLLQHLSSLIISRYLHTAERSYGNFATVITMLRWFYLGGIVTLFGAQLDIVRKERLYPRGLVASPATKADYRAYNAYANERTYHPGEGVRTKFPRHGAEG